MKCGSPEEPGDIKLRVYLKLFVSAACDGFRARERYHSYFTAHVLSPFSASAQQVCALAYSSGLLQRYRTAVCSWTVCLLALSVHGRVPLHVCLMIVASLYVSICIGSRVCVSAQRQPSFKERNGNAHTHFLQSAVKVDTSPRRQKTKIKYLSLKKSDQDKISFSEKAKPHFSCRAAYLLAWMRTESVFPLKPLLEIQHCREQRKQGKVRLSASHTPLGEGISGC